MRTKGAHIGIFLLGFLAAGGAARAAVSLGPWQIRHPHPSDFNRGLAHDGKKFVLVDGYGHVFTSISGRNWTPQPTPEMRPLRGLAYGLGKFVAVGRVGAILTSTDGTNWTQAVSPVTNDFARVLFTGERFVAVGARGTIVSSADGADFQIENSPVTKDLWSVSTGPGTVLAVGSQLALVSTNRGEWKEALVTTTNAFRGITYFKGAYHNGWYASADPMIWTNRVFGGGASNIVAVAATSDTIARVIASRYQISTDGVHWVPSREIGRRLYDLIVISDRFHLVGGSGIFFGETYNLISARHLQLHGETDYSRFTAVAAETNRFVARDFYGRHFVSRDAQSWRLLASEDPAPDMSVHASAPLPWARHNLNALEVSDDGVTWHSIPKPQPELTAAAAIDGKIVAAGTSNLWVTTDRLNWTKVQTRLGQPLVISEGGSAEYTGPVFAPWINSIKVGRGMAVAATSLGELLFSQDGLEWQTLPTIFNWIDDCAFTGKGMLIAAWSVLAEARFDGGVDSLAPALFQASENEIRFESPFRYYEIQNSADLTSWEFLTGAFTNQAWQIGDGEARFFRAKMPE